MGEYSYKLTEEIARWAFEIKCKRTTEWFVAFTNPTAGPWKAIKCFDKSSLIVGEVYRFDLEEVRPDIILVNDDLRLVVIIEAKDTLRKLISGDQSLKSVQVIVNLSEVLRNKGDSRYWGVRSEYSVLTGLLWGAQNETKIEDLDVVFEKYHAEIVKNATLISGLVIGIETTKSKDDNLECKFYYRIFPNELGSTISPYLIAQSLYLPFGQ